MAGSKKASDPLAVFERGKRGMEMVYRALRDENPAVQLAAAARMAAEAARRLPDAIDEELRTAGATRRRTRALALAAR